MGLSVTPDEKGSFEQKQNELHINGDVREGNASHPLNFIYNQSKRLAVDIMAEKERFIQNLSSTMSKLNIEDINCNDLKSEWDLYQKLCRGKLPFIECSNMYELLGPISDPDRDRLDAFKCDYSKPKFRRKKKVNAMNKLKHWRKSRNFVMSKWQEKLLDSQSDDSASQQNVHNVRLSPRKIRRKFKKPVVRSAWSPYSYDLEESIENRAFYRNKLQEIADKLPLRALDLISEYLFDWPLCQESLEDLVAEKMRKNRDRNFKRAQRRAKQKIISQRKQDSIKAVLTKWCNDRIEDIEFRSMNCFNAYTIVFQRINGLNVDWAKFPQYYYEWWGPILLEATKGISVQSIDAMTEKVRPVVFDKKYRFLTFNKKDRTICHCEYGKPLQPLCEADYRDILQLTKTQWPNIFAKMGRSVTIGNNNTNVPPPINNTNITTQSKDESFGIRMIMEMFDIAKDPIGYNYEKLIFHCERIIETISMMLHAQTWQLALYQLKIWISTTFNVGICSMIYNYVYNLFPPEDEVESNIGTQSADKWDWRQLFGDWKSFYNGEFLRKVIEIVGCILSLGFCTMSNIPFCTETFRKNFMKSELYNRSWPDLITCIIDSAIYIFDNCYGWFAGKWNFLEVIKSPSASYKYDKNMAYVKANIVLFEADDLEELGMSRYEFECLVEELTETTRALYQRSHGAEKRVMQLNIYDLERIKYKMLVANKAMTIRNRPFTYYTFGKTGVGKTAVSDLINNALLRANNFSPDPKYQVSINASDKYQSELQNYTILIKLDDLANMKSQFEEGSSNQLIIDYVNNNPRHALKADVDSKGKVLIQPKIFCATTNVKNVDASVKSNEPLSILQRLGYCITMVVKPEFCKAGSHMLDPNKMVNVVNDAWLFTIEEATPLHTEQINCATPYEFTAVKHNGRTMKDIGLSDMLKFLIEKSREHFVHQRRLLENVGVVQQTDLCPHDTYADICEDCLNILDPPGVIEVQSKDSVPEYSTDKGFMANLCFWILDKLPANIHDYKWYTAFGKYICGIFLVTKVARNIHTVMYIAFVSFLFFYMWFINMFSYLFTMLIIELLSRKIRTNIVRFERDCRRMKEKGMKAMQPLIEHKYKIAAGLGTVCAIGYIFKKLRPAAPLISKLISTQGSIPMTPKPDINFKPNTWVKPYIEPVPRTIQVSTTTLDQMQSIVADVLAYVTFSRISGGEETSCCGFPIKGNCWLLPYHCLRRGWDYVEIKRRPGDINSNRKCRINVNSWKRIGDTDMCVISLPSAGDVRDLTAYFPPAKDWYCEPVICIIKTQTGDIEMDDFVAEFSQVEFTDSQRDFHYKYPGWKYTTTKPTGEGMCMSPLISRGKFPWILGFHSAGVTGECDGYGHFVSRNQLEDTMEALFNRVPGDSNNINIQVHSTGNMILDFPEFNITHIPKIHSKSPFNFFDKPGVALLYGAHSGMRRSFRSAVEPTLICESVNRHLNLEMKYGPPKNIGNYKPWHADAMKVSQCIDMDLDTLALAYADLESHIFDFLEKNQEYKEIISPLSRVAVLSGVDACRGIDAINLNASAGFPRCKPKSKYVFESEEEHEFITRPLNVSDEIWAEIDKLEDTLARGERVYFVHRINLKDEPTKIGKEKVRTFAGCTLECLILIRTYFLPIAKMMMDNSTIFECAVGVNAHGPEWTKLTEHINKFGDDRIIAGDYGDYDSRMWCFIVLLAFHIFISIAKWAGYSDRQIMIMQGIATELAYGLTEYNGEFVMWLAQNLSGHGITVFINNLANSIYQRYSYYDIWKAIAFGDVEWFEGLQVHLGLSDEQFDMFKGQYLDIKRGQPPDKFSDVVSLICYGDDNKMSVSRDINFFNHCTISYSLGRCGIVYTMADKTSQSVPFIRNEDCSFLKRDSVWSDKYRQYLAPLDKNSLIKTLQANVTSKVLSREEQSVEALSSVMRELFYHGEDTFNEWRDKLSLVVEECKLEGFFKNRRLPTFQELELDYKQKYLCDSDIKNSHASEPSAEVAKNGVMTLDTHLPETNSNPLGSKAVSCQGIDSYLGMSSPARRICPQALYNLNKLVVNNQIANNTITNKVNSVGSLVGPENHQNIVFRDGTPQWTSSIEGAYDETREVGMDMSVPIESFFSRPVKVNLPNWIPGSATPYEQTLDPWTLFYQNKRVSNRISNFKLLQSTLKIKFVINGNMFYYGRLMVDYAPLSSYRTVDNFATNNRANIIPASQRTHIYLNPTSSQGGEIHMPFIWPRNALDITLGEWTGMGTLYMREMNPLKHANGSTSPVSITAYIWAEDVALSVPTTVNPIGISAQSKDEYGSKPISNIASNIAKISGRLESVPMIGPFAKATSIVSSGVGEVAKLFGFSRPAQIEDSMQMRPHIVSRLANTDCGDAVAKLTVDSKQELTIDPRVVGINTGDELDIKTIAGKESYLTTFPWAVTSVVDTLLWNTLVCPTVGVQNTAYTIDTAVQLPACAFAALPFQYWRGTMRYRFQIAASDFHRGRLKIVYDPSVVTGTETNLAFAKIVDLTTERDFTIDVSWGQTQTYLPTRTLAQMLGTFGTSAIVAGDIFSNGVLAVYVVNDLTTPNSVVNNDIQINVSVSMCDDAEFQAFGNRLRELSFVPQSQDSTMDSAELEQDNAPVITQNDESIMQCSKLDHTNDVYFGESIANFRTLLKRYYYYRSFLYTVAGRSNWALFNQDYPLSRGVVSNGIDTVLPGTTKANIVNTTLIGYLAPSFLAMRGGFRYKYCYNTDKTGDLSYAVVQRLEVVDAPITPGTVSVAYDVTNTTRFAYTQIGVDSTCATGAEVTYLRAQPVLEVEFPNYNNKRFTIPKNVGAPVIGSFYPGPNTHLIHTKVDNTATSHYDAYISVGEDFNLFLFQGAPPVCRKTFTPV